MKERSLYGIFLTALGVTNIGNWIYLIALNLAVWHVTGSPAAVAGIYVVGPIARIFSSFFVGTIIDRHDKKQLMIWSDIVRGVLVCLMPFLSSIWLIYIVIFLANIAAGFFGPSSTYLITTLVREEHRQQFNAVNSTLSSGSFMIGPALGGAIIAMSNTSVAMFINGATFFICAGLIALLPYEKRRVDGVSRLLTFTVIREDFRTVGNWLKENRVLLGFFLLYHIGLMTAFALDSQEMTFLKEVLSVSDATYGVTVSIAGIGAIAGGVAATAFVHKFSTITYIGAGFALAAFSYLAFYSTSTYFMAVIAFVTLGFFMAFSNTGYATVFQKLVPLHMMGRVGSMVNLVSSCTQIVFTTGLGFAAEIISLQLSAIILASIGCLLAASLYVHILKHKRMFT
jgi:MFS family permease